MNKIKAGAMNPLPIVPIVLVGAHVHGKANYATVGFVNGVNVKPATVCISLNKKHHTTRGIEQNSTFSLNLPSADQAAAADYCGLVSGKTTDKSALFRSFYGELKTAPMIEDFPIVCECKVVGRQEFAMDVAYFGEIHQTYLSEDILEGRTGVNIQKANPLLLGIDHAYRTAGNPVGRAYQMGWTYRAAETAPRSRRDSVPFRCRLEKQLAKSTLSIHCQATPADIPQAIGQSIFTVMQYAKELGVRPSGAPFAAYHGMAGQYMEMEIGWPFTQSLPGNARIQSGEIPAGRAATCIHIGPYEQLGSARAALNQWVLENGCAATGVAYEFYLHDPRTTPPEKLKTKIVFPLKQK